MNEELRNIITMKLDSQLITMQVVLEETATYRALGLREAREARKGQGDRSNKQALIDSLSRLGKLQTDMVENNTLVYLTGMLKLVAQMDIDYRIKKRFKQGLSEEMNARQLRSYEDKPEEYSLVEVFLHYREMFVDMKLFAKMYHLSKEEAECIVTRGYKAAFALQVGYPLFYITLKYGEAVKKAGKRSTDKFIEGYKKEHLSSAAKPVRKLYAVKFPKSPKKGAK